MSIFARKVSFLCFFRTTSHGFFILASFISMGFWVMSGTSTKEPLHLHRSLLSSFNGLLSSVEKADKTSAPIQKDLRPERNGLIAVDREPKHELQQSKLI
jgi:hypothetical protein